MSQSLSVNIQRLQAEIDELATFSEAPAPAVTRVLFTPQDIAARAWLTQKCLEFGLTVRNDSIGNFFARWEGTEPNLPAVASGSHIDAIPNAGRYDGVLGVLGVLEAFRALKASGFIPRRSLELIQFTAEEPTRFGLGCLGSRLLSGALSSEKAEALVDREKIALREWLVQMDWPKTPLNQVQLPKNTYRAFVELHIEQGPLLEQGGLDIGVVERIAAPSAFRLIVEGQGGHAGGVLMPGRKDALCGASEIALLVEKAARDSTSPDTVATTGSFRVEPNAINSIPFRVTLEIDLRDTDISARASVLDRIQSGAREICQKRGLQLRSEQINLDPPALAASDLVASVLAQAQAEGYSARPMISRAYHDSLFMALICPITMIFIPCRGGVSHRPDEYSSPEQMERGIKTLARVLREWSL